MDLTNPESGYMNGGSRWRRTLGDFGPGPGAECLLSHEGLNGAPEKRGQDVLLDFGKRFDHYPGRACKARDGPSKSRVGGVRRLEQDRPPIPRIRPPVNQAPGFQPV